MQAPADGAQRAPLWRTCLTAKDFVWEHRQRNCWTRISVTTGWPVVSAVRPDQCPHYDLCNFPPKSQRMSTVKCLVNTFPVIMVTRRNAKSAELCLGCGYNACQAWSALT